MVNIQKEILKKYTQRGIFNVEKHPSSDIYLYGYSYNSEMIQWDEININLRGIILNKNGDVLYRSFKKFFTFKSYLSKSNVLLSNQQIASLPECNYKIHEKIDGTLAFMYWVGDNPFLATQRSFSSLKAIKATEILYAKYSSLFSKLDKNKTYIFEAVFPEVKVVIDYGNMEDLFLIGIIDNQNGTELPLENMGFPLPYDYTNDLEYVTDLKDLQSLNIPNKEGFVVSYESGLKIKVKFPWYQQTHAVVNKIKQLQTESYLCVKQLKGLMQLPQNKLSKEKVVSCIKNHSSLDEILKNIPDYLYYNGLDQWLYSINGDSKHENGGEYFDVNRLASKYHDNIMWNFLKRIKEMYD